jgi:hypothetical protein
MGPEKENRKGGEGMKALRTVGWLSVFLLSIVSGAFAEAYIGIILDGFQKDCTVKSRGEDFPCEERRQLYRGDKVKKLPNLQPLKIKWAPYAGGKELDGTTLLVTFEVPEDKKGILQNVKEMVGFVKTKHSVVVGATRGSGGEPRVLQPGHHATLLPGQKVIFALESGPGKYILFRDSLGKEVFKRDLRGNSWVPLTPEEIGMKPSEVYSWGTSGPKSSQPLTVRLLGNEMTQQVTADLKEIEGEKSGEAEKKIKKATYLQFMSDSYPKDIDLYWLSYQLLSEIQQKGAFDQEDQTVVQELKRNFLKHVIDSR